MKNKVLIVAYSFPPVGGAGVQRVVKFVKYLREFHWEPLVLTVDNPSVPVMDEALLKDVPDNLKIFYAASFEPSYAQKQSFAQSLHGSNSGIKLLAKKILSGLLLPDVQVLWWPGLICSLIRIIRNERPNCIFVTAPPFSSFLPVVTIGAIFSTPVVLDFRDEWSFSREQWENAAQGKIAKALDHFFEKYVVSKCAAITAATQSYINTLDRHHRLPIGKGTAITNGFDEDDFITKKNHDTTCNSAQLKIVYSGTVWRATSLQNFITAMKEYLENHQQYEKNISFKIFGRVVKSELSHLKGMGLQEIVETFGYIDHENLIKEMNFADILLLALSDLPGSNKIIPAKTFEYMATGKHILAIIPEGETKTLLMEHYDNVTFAKPEDIVDIKEKLFQIAHTLDEIQTRKGKDVSQFSRKKLAGKLADVLNRVSKKRR